MKKSIVCVVICFLLLFQTSCTNGIVESNDTGSIRYIPNITQYTDTQAFMSIAGYKGELDLCSMQYNILDLNNNKVNPVFDTLQRRIYLKLNQHEEFNPNNFISLNTPSVSSNESEIGLFQAATNSYTTLINDPSASLLFDSVPDNKVIYYYQNKDSFQADAIWIMNRDGSEAKSIPLGIEAVPTEYYRVTPTTGFIYAYNAGADKNSVVGILNTELETVTLLMKPDRNYQIYGILDNQCLVEETDLQTSKLTLFFLDADGNRSESLFELDTLDLNGHYLKVLDSTNNQFFFAYCSRIDGVKILCFKEGEVEEVFPGLLDYNETSTHFDIMKPLVYNAQQNHLSFRLASETKDSNWYIANLTTSKISEIPLPANADYSLSSDGNYMLCANINNKPGYNTIIDAETQSITPLSEKLSLDFRSFYYNPIRKAYIVYQSQKCNSNTLYELSVNGNVSELPTP